MKKLIGLFTILAAIVATVCSIGLSSASAAEEPATLSEEVYSNNLYSAISYRTDSFVDSNGSKKTIHSNNFIGNTEDTTLFTNIMRIEQGKDLLVSMKFQLSTIYNVDTNYVFTTTSYNKCSGIEYLDEAYQKIITSSIITNNEVYSYNATDKTVTITFVYSITNSTAEYFMIAPKLKYVDSKGADCCENGSSVVDMYVSFIEKDKFADKTELTGLTIDYTPYNSGITWSHPVINIDSNFLTIKSSDPHAFMQAFVNKVTIKDKDGDVVTVIDYDSYLMAEAQIQGGIYEYIVEAVDKNGNRDFLLVSIKCSDTEAPVIIGTNEYNVPNTNLLSVDAIKATLTATDNVSTSHYITITLKYDYYTENYSKPGIYYVCFVATDEDGNVSNDFIVRIKVLDKNAPKFYNSDGLVVSRMSIYKSADSVLVMSDILNGIKAVDEIDGELEIKVAKDQYTGNGETVGTYLIVLKATDKSGNVAFYNVNIIVSEKMPSKTILIDNKIILVEKTKKLNKDDFHSVIQMLGTYNTTTTSYTAINSEIYSASYKEPGDYIVEYSVTTTAGYETDGVFIVRVIEARTADYVDEKEEEPGFIESILKWIWDLLVSFFEFIGSLFTGGKE